MAGESPDKSEHQQRSSGETARGGGDPQLAVLSADGRVADRPPTEPPKSGGAAERAESAVRAAAEAAGCSDSAEPAERAGSAEPADGEDADASAGRADGSAGSSERTELDKADRRDKSDELGDSEGLADGAGLSADGESSVDAAPSSRPDKGAAQPSAVVAASVTGTDTDAPVEPDTDAATEQPGKGPGEAATDSPKHPMERPAAPSGSQPPAGEEPAGDVGSPGKPMDQPTAVFRAVRPTEGEKPAAPDREAPQDRVTMAFGALPKADGKPSGDGDGDGDEDERGPLKSPVKQSAADAKPADGKEGAERPVGQPTTAFKAVRPAGPSPDSGSGGGEAPAEGPGKRVDQPTTPFKAARPGDRPAGAPDAERASRFVPLKSVDSAPRKPPSAVGPAGAEAAGSGAPAVSSEPGAAPALAESERTKQQPLPDPPPLELLAQLTNTPPPPQTPLRTFVRRIKIWTPLVLLLAIAFAIVQGARPLPEPSLQLTAKARYAFDGAEPSIPWPAEGQAVLEVEGLGSLGSFGEEKPVPIASVAKVMTAYVILRDHPVAKGTDGATITIDQQAADDAKKGADGESVVEVAEGDKVSQKEAVQAIMIASANNVARLLARWDAGSEEAFVKKMNDAAKDLGMKNTTYTDPSGLREQTVSTAADQVKLGKTAMDLPLFREIVRMPSYLDSKGVNHSNWNRLVSLDGVVGIKTGTTTMAGGNLLFAAEKEIGGTTQLIVGAVLGQNKPPIIDTVINESKKLIDAAQDVLVARTVVKKGDVVGQVDDGLGGTTPVVATEDVTAVGWPGLTVDLALTDDGKAVPHEAKAGTRVGTLTVGSGPGQVKVPVTLQKDLVEPSLGSKLTRIT